MPERRRGSGCGKKVYRSKRDAHEAVRKMGNSVRVYPCPECPGSYHVTKDREGWDKKRRWN